METGGAKQVGTHCPGVAETRSGLVVWQRRRLLVLLG